MGEALHDFLENAPAMLEVSELVIARAGRRQKHDVARLRRLEGLANGRFQIAAPYQSGGTGQVLGNAVRRGADQKRTSNTTLDQRPERRIRRSLVFPAQDQADRAVKG